MKDRRELIAVLLEQQRRFWEELPTLLREGLRKIADGTATNITQERRIGILAELAKVRPQNESEKSALLLAAEAGAKSDANFTEIPFQIRSVYFSFLREDLNFYIVKPEKHLHQNRKVLVYPESCLLLPENIPSPLETAIGNEPDPAEVVENADLLERVFEHLKAEEHVILQMFADGHTDEEVAVLLGTTPEAIKKRRQRLINRLRQSLAS